jgi:hypothetical protein
MPDDKSKRGPADRSRINIHESYELEYWTKHFGVTKQQIIDCVKQVGVMAKDVQRALGK